MQEPNIPRVEGIDNQKVEALIRDADSLKTLIASLRDHYQSQDISSNQDKVAGSLEALNGLVSEMEIKPIMSFNTFSSIQNNADALSSLLGRFGITKEHGLRSKVVDLLMAEISQLKSLEQIINQANSYDEIIGTLQSCINEGMVSINNEKNEPRDIMKVINSLKKFTQDFDTSGSSLAHNERQDFNISANMFRSITGAQGIREKVFSIWKDGGR